MTSQEIMQKQWELVNLVEQLEHVFVAQKFDNEENRQKLAAVKALIDAGVDLNFKQRSILDRAVATNSIELVEMIIAAGFPITEANGRELLYTAADKGAEQVVRFLIEEKGVNPAKRSSRDFSVLAIARSSRFSRNVLLYLNEVMRETKLQRPPAPKKLHELTEENMMKWLPQVAVSEPHKTKLNAIIESLFIEEYSVTLDDFYRIISAQHPELIFACIELIKNALTSAATNKIANDVSGQTNVHHGNLEITGNLQLTSMMVTGNLTVKGYILYVHGSQLYVGGNVECENLYSLGPLIVGGNVKAGKVQAQYNDHPFVVKQTLQADTLITQDRQVIAGHFDVKERIEEEDEE